MLFSLVRLDYFLPHGLLLFINAFVCIFLASITIQTGREDRKHQIFTIFLIIETIHYLGAAIKDMLPVEIALYLVRGYSPIYLFTIPTGIHFVHEVLGLKKRRWLVKGLYLLIALSIPLVVTSHYITELRAGDFGYMIRSAWLQKTMSLLALVCLIYGVFLLLRGILSDIASQKQRELWFILTGFALNAILQVLGSLLSVMGLKTYLIADFSFIPLMLTSYGLLRYHVTGTLHSWVTHRRITQLVLLVIWIPLLVTFLHLILSRQGTFRPDFATRFLKYSLPPLFTVLVCFGLASFCATRGDRSKKTIIFGLSVWGWGLLALDMIYGQHLMSAGLSLKIMRIVDAFSVWQPALVIHLVYLLLNNPHRRLIYQCYLFAIFWTPLSQTEHYFAGMTEFFWGWYPVKQWAYEVFGAVAGAVLLRSVWLLYQSWKACAAGQRKEHLFVFAGVAVSGGLNLASMLPMFGFAVYPLGNFTFIPMLLMAYGIFHHDLLKLNPAAKKMIRLRVVQTITVLGYASLIPIIVYATHGLTWSYVLDKTIPYGLPPLASFLCCLTLSIFLFRIAHNNTESQLFSLICLLYAILNSRTFLSGVVPDAHKALMIDRWAHFFFVMNTGVNMHLLFLVTHQQKRWWISKLYYGIGIVMIPLSQTSWYFQGENLFYWGFFAQKNILFDFMSLVWFIGVVYALTRLVLFYRQNTRPVEKQRIFYLMTGWVLSSLMIFGNIPALHGYDIYPAGNFIFIPMLVMAYGILIYNLTDVLGFLRNLFYWVAVIGSLILLMFVVNDAITYWAIPIPWSLLLEVGCGVTGYGVFKILWKSVLDLFFPTERISQKTFNFLIELLSQATRYRELFQFVAYSFFRLFPAGKVTLAVALNADSDQLEGWAYQGLKRGFFENSYQPGDNEAPVVLSVNHPLLKWIEKQPLLVTQEDAFQWMLNQGEPIALDDLLFQTELIQPIVYENKLTGVLLVDEKINNSAYSTEERNFIYQVGMALGPYLHSISLMENLEEQVRQRTREISHINQVMRVANATLDMEEVIRVVMRSLSGILDFNQCGIFLLNRETQKIELSNYYGTDVTPARLHAIQRIDLPYRDYVSYLCEACLTRESYYFSPITQEMLHSFFKADLEICNINPIAAIIMFPLLIQDKPIGTLVFAHTTEPFSLREEDLDKIQRYVTQIASAVNNAYLYESLKTTRLQLAESERVAAMIQTFQKFVPQQFLRRIAGNGLENISLGNAQSDDATILFSDIREFTRFSETISPQELLNFLNAYFQRMSGVLHQHEGFIDKFIGDAIMAIFDFPEGRNHSAAEQAVRAAIAMIQSLNEYNQYRASSGYQAIQIGIGIHSGPVIFGTVGSKDRMDSTVLGDTVNLASRLEGLTKRYGVSILVSDDTLALVEMNRFAGREVDFVRVKGKDRPVTIFEIYEQEPPPLKQLKRQAGIWISRGLRYRHLRQWEESQKSFEKALEVFPHDSVAKFHFHQYEEERLHYVSKIAEDGAFILETK
ncbi:MAG: GAF domain-containing protein [SAR324 cluster bacterium]|nr:GAF domain-containing protein [SAR324 cluster bacterium]